MSSGKFQCAKQHKISENVRMSGFGAEETRPPGSDMLLSAWHVAWGWTWVLKENPDKKHELREEACISGGRLGRN